MSATRNPYALTAEAVEEPPDGLRGALRRIGPGLVMASAVVGSGELVAATVLGAENGYGLLWLILLSCGIKVVVQNELGRYAIGTGETTLEAFDRVPGPRWRVGWVVWAWFAMVCFVLFAIGGMLGAVAEVLGMIVPSISITAGVWVVVAVTLLLLWHGTYQLIERASLGLVVGFTAMTVVGAVLLFRSPGAISVGGLLDGLRLQMPEGGFSTAVTVFGGTGVGAGELVMYPYWCIEKGYARFTGARDESASWIRRALGWIRVMGLDVVFSLLVYTFATLAFYLLGAGVLNGLDSVPQGADMVATLSAIFTETLGAWSRPLFLVGAVAVLYSTVFAMTAAHSRLFADFLAMLGLYRVENFGARERATRWLLFPLILIPCATFLLVLEPVVMVKISGIAQAVMLPVIGCVALYLRYQQLPGVIAPGKWLTFALWVTAAAMAVVMGTSLLLQLG